MRSRLAVALRRPVNRLTIAALFLWVLFLVAEEPWRFSAHRIPFYEAPAEFFLKIGYNVARAFGLHAHDMGFVQFCAGAAALIAVVRLPFWAFSRREPTARP